MLTQLSPVQALSSTSDQAESDGRSNDAVRSGNRQFKECCNQQPKRAAGKRRYQSEHQLILMSFVNGYIQDSFTHGIGNFVACRLDRG